MQGKVEKMSEGTNNFGRFFSLTISGVSYSAFGSAVSQAAQVQVGDTVEFTFEVKQGKYNNIKTISVMTAGATASAPSSGGVAPKVDQRDAMMLLSYAKDLVVTGGLEPGVAVETIFRMKKDVFDRLSGLNPTQ